MAYYRKKGDIWYFTIEIPSPTGERKRVERPGGYSRQEAKAAYRKAIADLEFKRKYDEINLSYHDLLDEWMEKYVEVNLSDNTRISYQSKITNHIVPSLGKCKLKDLTAKMLQEFINEKKSSYKKATLKIFVAILKASLSYAVHPCEYLTISPADHLSMPKYKELTALDEDAYIFSREEINKIAERFPEGHKFHVPIQISYHTGMRLGECLALEWECIDFENKLISIKHTLLDKEGVKQGTTKSLSSRRVIPFNAKLYRILKKQSAYQAANKLEYGKYYLGNDTNYVCTERSGEVLTANAMRYFGQWCKKEFGNGSFHSLRHTHASILLENGFSMTYVSKRLGHANVSTTANIYSHVTNSMEDSAKKMLEQIL